MDHTWLEEETKTLSSTSLLHPQTSQKLQRNTYETLLLSTNQKPNQNQEREQKDEEKWRMDGQFIVNFRRKYGLRK